MNKRIDLLQAFGSRLYDDQLDRFSQCAIEVLKQPDPKFELPPDERYLASVHKKILPHSDSIRKGIAEGLALISCLPEYLVNCSKNKPEAIASTVVREILFDADWILWASLNNLLPTIAESSPEQFLESVSVALRKDPNPFLELFSQEGVGITGTNYMTGLLWALETLAWDERYLSRATVILGELAMIDPGGNWANRPLNSLVTIFLPWLPQTIASPEKRNAAMKALVRESPDISWKVFLELLPSNQQVSSGSRKPQWRKSIPEGWAARVSGQEYNEQIQFYAKMVVDFAATEISKLTELADHIENLPKTEFDRFLLQVKSVETTSKPEQELLPLWTKLMGIVARHKKFKDAEWALKPDLIQQIEDAASSFTPKNLDNLHKRLFNEGDFQLYEEKGDWREQHEKLEKRRQSAVLDILKVKGIPGVISFAESVRSSRNVGTSLGFSGGDELDGDFLPSMLLTANKKLEEFIGGFIWGRYWSQRWKWVDVLDISAWSLEQKAFFFAQLPFELETWQRVQDLLGDEELAYWKITPVNAYQDKNNLSFAINKLAEYGRPREAMSCVHRIFSENLPFDKALVIEIVLAAAISSESPSSMDMWDLVEVIKALQNDSSINQDDLFRIEWAYLPLLSRHEGISPKTLENRLASDPEFFGEIIRRVFRPDNETEQNVDPTEDEKAIATNAYRLLREWQTPPGKMEDGTFSEEQFNKWIDAVENICSKSGHIDIALYQIGEVLVYSPQDPGGMWIHTAVAEKLNSKNADRMRDGFRLEVYNSRGAHFVDPTGKDERELAAKYRKQADDLEGLGFHRFAATINLLADNYEREAEQVIADHKRLLRG